jgi:hypothetical protein
MSVAVPGYPNESQARACHTGFAEAWDGHYTALCEQGRHDVEYNAVTHEPLHPCPCPPRKTTRNPIYNETPKEPP